MFKKARDAVAAMAVISSTACAQYRDMNSLGEHESMLAEYAWVLLRESAAGDAQTLRDMDRSRVEIYEITDSCGRRHVVVEYPSRRRGVWYAVLEVPLNRPLVPVERGGRESGARVSISEVDAMHEQACDAAPSNHSLQGRRP